MSNQSDELADLLTDIAIPLAQLSLYRHLWATDNMELRATDMLAITDQVLETLRRHGMNFDGTIGAVEPFDVARHELLVAAEMEQGKPVEICLCGVSLGDRQLTRIGVRPAVEIE